MATILSFLSGRQITDDNGAPQSGAQLFHYQAGTTSDLTVYSNQAGTTPHAQPVVCDAGGFVPLIYVDDSSDWKVVIQDEDDATLQTYDNLPAAPADESGSGFAPPLHQWTQVTSAASPVTLAASDAGKAYEADTTSGNIEFDLPSAASVGNGKGFLFKKVVAANSMIIDQSGSETIDNSATAITITAINTIVGIFSNGAEWYRVDGYLDAVALAPLLPGLKGMQVFTSSDTYTPTSGTERVLVISTGGGGGGGGADNDASSNSGAAAGGGGAGGTAIETFSAAQIGASQTVTIGAAGTAGAAASGTNGGAGGNTTFGALHTANGGAGGTGTGLLTGSTGTFAGGAGGTATGGTANITGGSGCYGIGWSGGTSITSAVSGSGGGSFWGSGGASVTVNNAASVAGGAGLARGAGGAGGASKQDAGGAAGGAGAAGICVVFEFGYN